MNTRRLLATALLCAAPAVFAQDAPPPPASGPGGPPPPARQTHGRQNGRDDMRGKEDLRDGDMRGPIGHLLPPGPWWRSPQMAQAIGLSSDQQKRIDDLFLQSRMKLIDMHAALEKEQLVLEPLLNANPIDQGKALAEISKIADTRAELEKADARMLLSIRAVLTADQWTKLQASHRGRHDDRRDDRKMGGPDGGKRGPGGPRQGQGGGQQPLTPPQG